MLDTLGEKQICIDGKKIKGVNPRSRGNTGLYIVNAWVSENELCIGQKKVADKSNEITAIPEIINSLDIENAVVSIDAMGCQKEIASVIMAKKGHYLLSLKSNQSELFEDVVCGFKARSSDCFQKNGNILRLDLKLVNAVFYRRKTCCLTKIYRFGRG
ncbi:ISAs1 family transposase [Capnocytophaga canimorsus]|uniref:ISAs1 family transposase n=1 Tax=Capnocytophaga canimorsus TaxID=28188 RepID=UPI003858B844